MIREGELNRNIEIDTEKKEALSCRQAPIFQNTVEIKKTIKKRDDGKKTKDRISYKD